MYRKQLEHLKVRQRSPTRKPLLLTGARQVGKTFLLKEFGKEFYQNTIYINFDRIIPEISSLFETNIDPQKILTTLAIYFKQEIIP
ncbi:MAG: AAA family ATPase [Candidatus Peribacteria bacterium]|jgi:predicted AAA+ superfamily ATPase|nr:AAA family ATPase [Candidatus Peribacteria bacterium]